MSARRIVSWLASWRVSLRMAWRDMAGHLGRSVLIVVLIGLPVLLMTGGATLYTSVDISPRDRIPLLMGRGQALLTGPSASAVVQDPIGRAGYDGAATALPGQSTTQDGQADTQGVRTALTTMTAARVIGERLLDGRVHVGRISKSASILAIDTRADDALADLAGKVELLSGRLPTQPDEVLVTTKGEADGIPTSGTLEVTVAGNTTHVRVVGVGKGFVGDAYAVSAVGLVAPLATTLGEGPATDWILQRDTPVTWSEVRRLNAYGFTVYSRAVLEDPPTELDLSPDQQSLVSGYSFDDPLKTMAALASAGLLLETTLTAGPAFAVSAARKRRTLAMTAANGGTRSQLRRLMLGEALLLGAVSAGAAALLGLVGARTILAVMAARSADPVGGYEIPAGAVLLVGAAAILSAVIAALVPARGLGRLDIVSALRGHALSGRPHPGMPVLGLLLAGAGAVALLVGAQSRFGYSQRQLLLVGGSFVLVIGALLLVPMVLAVVGKLASVMPLSLRLATREATRQRGRATPTIAAILAGTALATTVAVALASDNLQESQDYRPAMTIGWGRVRVMPETSAAESRWTRDDIVALVHRAAPGSRTVDIGSLAGPLDGVTDPTGTHRGVVVLARLGSCRLAEALAAPLDEGPGSRCQPVGTVPTGSTIVTADPAYLGEALSLTDSQRDAVVRGAIVVPDGEFPDPDGDSGSARSITLTSATATYADGQLVSVGDSHQSTLEAVVVPRRDFLLALGTLWGARPAAAVAAPTAQRLGWPSHLESIRFVGGDGSAVSPAAATQIDEALGDSAILYVERGFERDDTLLLVIVFGVVGLLVLVATLVATAISTAEGASTSATLAAVGATRRTRRRLAATHAAWLAAVGCALGFLVGLVPGVAATYPLTVRAMAIEAYAERLPARPDPVIVIPWAPLSSLILVVPVIGAAIAWYSVRREPTLTRRLS